MEKIYKVTFIRYDNYFEDNKIWDSVKDIYIDVGKEPFLIKESDLEYYKQCGEGIRSLECVGHLHTPKID